MDAPLLTAIIGVGGSLMGTIVGGCLTMYSNFYLNRRRERAEFRIGCRLIAAELDDNEALMSALLARKSWGADLEPSTQAWAEHQRFLASYLSDEDWDDVRLAVHAVHLLRLVLAGAHAAEVKTMSDDQAVVLAKAVAEIHNGKTSLQPYLTKPRWRLLKPLGIRQAVPRPPVSG